MAEDSQHLKVQVLREYDVMRSRDHGHVEDSTPTVSACAVRLSKQIQETSESAAKWEASASHVIYPDGGDDKGDTESDVEDLPPIQMPQDCIQTKKRFNFKNIFRRPTRHGRNRSSGSEETDTSTPTVSSSGKDLTDKFRFMLFKRGNSRNAECMLLEEQDGGLSVKIGGCEDLANSMSIQDDVEDDFVLITSNAVDEVHVDGFSLSISYDDLKRRRLIGSGAFGMVFEAMWDGRLVALKEVSEHHYEYESGEKFIDSLRKELSVLKEVGQHENVVKCFGGSLSRPHVFMLSELMERSLGDLIHGGKGEEGMGALPITLTLNIMLDILAGLDHLHSMQPQIVHRDLKPENILLDKNHRALVADFGLSRTKAGSYLKTVNAHAGTPCYLAPEVLSGRIGEKMDIYAVGVTLWECLTGKRPWRDYVPIAILLVVNEGNRLEFPPEIFPEEEGHPMSYVKALIERCWDGNPKNRPGCKELIADIRDLQARFPEFRSDE
ncbi:hypothetical protein BSKO_10202 [Bryopsis sp. KO-2023]|nr:hypothetical protein BSKO_10202 [Bryopsis sp. KO-2023]